MISCVIIYFARICIYALLQKLRYNASRNRYHVAVSVSVSITRRTCIAYSINQEQTTPIPRLCRESNTNTVSANVRLCILLEARHIVRRRRSTQNGSDDGARHGCRGC
jgi:hypothetical protein